MDFEPIVVDDPDVLAALHKLADELGVSAGVLARVMHLAMAEQYRRSPTLGRMVAKGQLRKFGSEG